MPTACVAGPGVAIATQARHSLRPGNTLSRDEVVANAVRFATYRGGGSEGEMTRVADEAKRPADSTKVRFLLAGRA
jgi:hypothetical protein